MAGAADAVGQHPGEGHLRPVQLQPQRDRPEGLRHRARVDHRQHRQAKAHRQLGTGRRAVVQAHHAFDQDQVRLARRLPEQFAAVRLAAHPQVELVTGLTAGVGVHHRVDEVGAGLEHPHPQAALAPVAGQCRGDSGFSLPGGGGADQQGGARTRGALGRNRSRRHARRPHAPCGSVKGTHWLRGRGRTNREKEGQRRSTAARLRPPRCQYRCSRPVSGLARAVPRETRNRGEAPSQVTMHPVAWRPDLDSLTVAGAAPESWQLIAAAHRFPV